MSDGLTRPTPSNMPSQEYGGIFAAKPYGTINYGDPVYFSGEYVFASQTGEVYSAAGIAAGANPVPDQYGVLRSAETINVIRNGEIIVTPTNIFRANPSQIGRLADVLITGSAYYSPTGHSGRPAEWGFVDHYTFGFTDTPIGGMGVLIKRYIDENGNMPSGRVLLEFGPRRFF